MFHFPDSDTGYYDTEEAFYALDAQQEAAEEARYLAELEASYDGGQREDQLASYIPPSTGPDYQQIGADPARDLGPLAALGDIDPETGYTAAEMDEADRMPLRFQEIGDLDLASHVTFPPEMSVGQTITAKWGRSVRRRKGVA